MAKITVSVSNDDPTIKKDIEQKFINHFGQIGESETGEHFVARKCEEWLLGVYTNQAASEAVTNVHQETKAAILEAVEIKQKPEVKR